MIEPELPCFGPTARLHHAGIAVRSIVEIAPEATIFNDPIQEVNVAFVSIGGARWELVEPAQPNSSVATILARGNPSIIFATKLTNSMPPWHQAVISVFACRKATRSRGRFWRPLDLLGIQPIVGSVRIAVEDGGRRHPVRGIVRLPESIGGVEINETRRCR